MQIGGLEKMTLIDYPGEVALIVFTQGCNFRCQFCYNPMLVLPEGQDKLKYSPRRIVGVNSRPGVGAQKDHHLIEEGDFFVFLRSRTGKLDGVVITGGEPTIQPDLPEFIKKIKDLGFKVKLDTNGTNPEMLEKLITALPGKPRLVDYVAMDIKAPLNKYIKVTGLDNIYPVQSSKNNFGGILPEAELLHRVKKSVKMIMKSGLPYEFRTTVVPGLLNKENIAEMAELIKGADKWYLQFFKSDTDLINKDFQGKARFTEKEMKEMAEIGRKYVKLCEVRG